jgi:hypothetical protein
MSKLTKKFEIPDNCSPDIELMSIWSEAYHDYATQMTTKQLACAITWFKSYVDCDTRKDKSDEN